MSDDDHQEIYDEIFKRMEREMEVSPEARLMAAILHNEQGTEGTPSGSQCPMSYVPNYEDGDKLFIYATEGREQIALTDEKGALLNIHIMRPANKAPELHIAVNGAEVWLPLEFWKAASVMIEEAIDDED